MVAVPVYGAVPRVVMQAIAYETLRDGVATQVPTWVSISLALLVCLTIPSLRKLSWRKTLAIALIGAGTALLAAIVGGLAFGAGLVFLANLLDRSVSTTEEAVHHFDLPVHGVIAEIVTARQQWVRRTKVWTIGPAVTSTSKGS